MEAVDASIQIHSNELMTQKSFVPSFNLCSNDFSHSMEFEALLLFVITKYKGFFFFVRLLDFFGLSSFVLAR